MARGWAKGNIPMKLARVFEQSQRDTMHRRIAPSLIEEPSRAVQMVEIILIRLTPPETHICDLEVGPEMARRVAVCFEVVIWPALAVY